MIKRKILLNDIDRLAGICNTMEIDACYSIDTSLIVRLIHIQFEGRKFIE